MALIMPIVCELVAIICFRLLLNYAKYVNLLICCANKAGTVKLLSFHEFSGPHHYENSFCVQFAASVFLSRSMQRQLPTRTFRII